MTAIKENTYRRTMILFTTMGAIYGNLWNSQFANEELLRPALKIWDQQLKHLTDEEIEFAVNKCIKELDLPPTLPRFLGMCKLNASDLGIPSAEECFVTQNYLYQTLIGQVPTWDVNHFSRSELRRCFKEQYAQYMREEMGLANDPCNRQIFIKNKMRCIKKKKRLNAKDNLDEIINIR